MIHKVSVGQTQSSAGMADLEELGAGDKLEARMLVANLGCVQLVKKSCLVRTVGKNILVTLIVSKC